MKKVYLLVFEWSTDDGQDVDIQAFDSYEKAKQSYEELIHDETTSGNSWAADAFDENGNILHGYELEEHCCSENEEYDCWWELTCKNDWYMHDFISIRTLEVQ